MSKPKGLTDNDRWWNYGERQWNDLRSQAAQQWSEQLDRQIMGTDKASEEGDATGVTIEDVRDVFVGMPVITSDFLPQDQILIASRTAALALKGLGDSFAQAGSAFASLGTVVRRDWPRPPHIPAFVPEFGALWFFVFLALTMALLIFLVA